MPFAAWNYRRFAAILGFRTLDAYDHYVGKPKKSDGALSAGELETLFSADVVQLLEQHKTNEVVIQTAARNKWRLLGRDPRELLSPREARRQSSQSGKKAEARQQQGEPSAESASTADVTANESTAPEDGSWGRVPREAR